MLWTDDAASAYWSKTRGNRALIGGKKASRKEPGFCLSKEANPRQHATEAPIVTHTPLELQARARETQAFESLQNSP